MERNCKNCNELIYAGKSHCSGCGCKWIDNRITMRQVGNDFADMYIGIDTKFVRTYIDLFKKPEAVILGYMNGRRVNYMDAVRYFLLALFVTGIYTFVLKNSGVFETMITSQEEMYQQMNYSEEQLAMTKKFNAEFGKWFFDFQGFFLMLTIPVLALIARITFWGKTYFNFTEQIVFYMYTYGHSVIVTTPFTIVFILIYPESVMYLGVVTFPLMYFYNIFCYKRCFRLTNSQLLTKTLLSFLVALGVLIVIGLLCGIIGIIVGFFLKSQGII